MRTSNLTVHRKTEEGWIYLGDILPDGSTTGFVIDDQDTVLPDLPDSEMDLLSHGQRVWEICEETIEGFGEGAQLDAHDVESHWEAYTRNLSGSEMRKLELQGRLSGISMGQDYKQSA
jgi:hypothetical protein